MLEGNYDAASSEKKWQQYWEKENIYRFDPESKKPIFSIDTPPPTVSGKMHIGHAFSFSQQDMIARYKRMKGFELFYPFGTDDNGLATDRLIEKMKNVRSALMDRKEYIKLCLNTLDEMRPAFIQDWKDIAMSCDFNIFYSTINDHCRKLSQKSFIDLYKAGREYRKEGPTIWCAECGMAIAQVEMQDEELESKFHEIIFKVEDGKHTKDLVIATTRPELLPACVAIFAHPEDERYKPLFGKKARVPLFNHEVAIMASEKVKPDKGTGILMCCTFGDQDDIEHYKAFNLPMRVVITKNGRMTELADKYKGLKIKQAREAIVSDLKAAGLHLKETKIKHAVNVHERCGHEIEIMNSKQWFIRYLDLKDDFLRIGREMKWYPDFMINRFDNWVKGLQWDWSLSRQRHYGVPFPVWYCEKCDHEVMAEEKQLPVDPLTDNPPIKKCSECGHDKFVPEKDVMDTWATSSLTPKIAASLFPKIEHKLYPMSLRPQAHDIITFWLFNTVVKSHLHNNKIPWNEIMISGWALDPKGEKMSKSKGNVIEPRIVITKYCADALRFWASGTKLGEDIAFQEKEFVTGKKTITKLWNAAKFCYQHLADFDESKEMDFDELELMDRWLLLKFNSAVKEATAHFDNYNFSEARKVADLFFWRDLCDNYLEIAKRRLYSEDKEGKQRRSTQTVLNAAFLGVLKFYAPIMPFITEELYQAHYAKHESDGCKRGHRAEWPKHDAELKDIDAYSAGELAINIIGEVRKYKAQKSISLKEVAGKVDVKSEAAVYKMDKKAVEEWKEDLQKTINVSSLNISEGKQLEISIR